MVTKPVCQVGAIDLAASEIEHETLLLIDGGGDLRAVEDQEGFHGGVADLPVAVDERVVLSLLGQRRVQIDATERGPRLSEAWIKSTEVAKAGRAATNLEETAVQLDHLPQGEISHQARRRYSSSFFRRTRSAARWNSASGVASRSAIAARASS